MKDIIKKTLLAGVGAMVVTKEKVESALDDLVKQGKISSADARRLADKIGQEGRREFETLRREIGERLTVTDRKAQERIDALEARVTALERTVAGASQDTQVRAAE